MTFLRPEAKRFAQRRVPIKFARPFDRPAPLVSIDRRRWRGKSRGVKKTQGRTPADAHVRIANLVRSERKARPCTIIGCQATQICRNWISGLPRHNILQPPITQNVPRHATISVTMVLAERQLIQRSQPHLMAYVERR